MPKSGVKTIERSLKSTRESTERRNEVLTKTNKTSDTTSLATPQIIPKVNQKIIFKDNSSYLPSKRVLTNKTILHWKHVAICCICDLAFVIRGTVRKTCGDSECVNQHCYDYKEAYRKANREKFRAYAKRYYQTHKEILSIKTKKYQEANKEKLAECRRRWNREHPERIQAAKKRHYDKHKDILTKQSLERYYKNRTSILERRRKRRAEKKANV